jgi:ABC-type branched-subunit amino acid transport system substrate-binding protein
VRAAILLALVACGPKVQQGWVEREAPLGTSHAGADTTGGAPAPVDVSKVDLSNIDSLDEATVLTVLERIGDAAPAAALALRAARIAHHRGDDGEARALLARAANAADEPSVHAQLAELAKAVALPPVNPSTIAVLLPLSGRFASIGRELRAAILQAQATAAPGTTWLFIDTKGEADGASAAVEQAHAKGALGILGPVGQREALAAARAASLRGMPIVLLAPGDGADPAAGVFRMVDSPADEGRAAARVAQVEGYPAVGVFAPRDDLGAEAADAFVAEAQTLGMTIAARGTYDPTGEVEGDVKAFLGLVPAQNPRFAAHLAKVGPKKAFTTFSPDVPYSLLYVPDRYDRAAIVAAFLPYFGVELRTSEFPDPERLKRKHGGNLPQVVQLVGNSGWNHPSLPIRGGMAVQGAMIVDTCTAARDQAHDAALIVAAARKDAAGANDPRAALRERIAKAKLDDGACGPASMDVDGELHREPNVLEVAGDQLIPAP